jgi:hypothetical protein
VDGVASSRSMENGSHDAAPPHDGASRSNAIQFMFCLSFLSLIDYIGVG